MSLSNHGIDNDDGLNYIVDAVIGGITLATMHRDEKDGAVDPQIKGTEILIRKG